MAKGGFVPDNDGDYMPAPGGIGAPKGAKKAPKKTAPKAFPKGGIRRGGIKR